MTDLHVLHVFCAEDGSGGNALGVFLDGPGIALEMRQGTATDLGFTETTGAAAIRLGALLGRPVRIRQGRGSVIEVRPRDDGLMETGGRVVLDEVRGSGAVRA